MSTFDIVSSTLNSNFLFRNDALDIQGSYQKDALTDELQTVSCSCYRHVEEGQGEFVGNFSGHNRNGQMRYSISEMSTEDMEAVRSAIAEIEQDINNENV